MLKMRFAFIVVLALDMSRGEYAPFYRCGQLTLHWCGVGCHAGLATGADRTVVDSKSSKSSCHAPNVRSNNSSIASRPSSTRKRVPVPVNDGQEITGALSSCHSSSDQRNHVRFS